MRCIVVAGAFGLHFGVWATILNAFWVQVVRDEA